MIKNRFLRKLYVWYRERYFWKLKKKKVEEIFSDVYKNNEWGGTPGTFHSGEGTHNPNFLVYVENVAAFINEHKVKSVLDIGCGDFKVMSKILEKVDVNYTGGDVVKELIEHHQQHYATDKTRFISLNAIEDDLPDAEMVTIRQVLQHLSNDQILKILSKLSKFRYVLITEHMLLGDLVAPNIDKIPGPHIRTRVFSSVVIDAPPFNVKNAKVLFEYRFDEKIKSRLYPAVIRAYLVTNK
ncbi:class I SAM-dependent methyltransferase [Niastella caeni]|uniref:Class I SAM-dependent methyltransferase n=1 Tax=Niastella caeni TaxID=2569763 RepID=A0A4S8HUT9_9BACT|nr:class I SAM-dependent methyltransferase [Niastella caeni]THU39377.1 class I SAM-dependent methyltransferase [Niastella caeni]